MNQLKKEDVSLIDNGVDQINKLIEKRDFNSASFLKKALDFVLSENETESLESELCIHLDDKKYSFGQDSGWQGDRKMIHLNKDDKKDFFYYSSLSGGVFHRYLGETISGDIPKHFHYYEYGNSVSEHLDGFIRLKQLKKGVKFEMKAMEKIKGNAFESIEVVFFEKGLEEYY